MRASSGRRPSDEAGLCAASCEATCAALAAALDGSGLAAWAPLGAARLGQLTSHLGPAARARYGLDSMRGCVVAALSYGEGRPEPPEWALAYPGPLAGLARFARANWYAEIVAHLRAAVARARLGLEAAGLDGRPLAACRYLANSGLPEKPLALEAGLGFAGRNSLVVVAGREGELGSALLLGLLLLPFDPEPYMACLPRPEAEALRPGASCGACRACVEACPTGALSLDGSFRRERCIQHWTARAGELPPELEAAWGGRLYGCDSCLEACPHFRPDPRARCDRGLLGPGLPASWLLAAPEAEIRERLKGTALGLGWMETAAFKRNAALALRGNIDRSSKFSI